MRGLYIRVTLLMDGQTHFMKGKSRDRLDEMYGYTIYTKLEYFT